jgi:hypothetical protein
VETSTFVDDAYIMHINCRTCCDVVFVVIYSENTQNGRVTCALYKHHQQMFEVPTSLASIYIYLITYILWCSGLVVVCVVLCSIIP